MAPPVEICIPTTSQVPSTAGEKPYTLYNITLRLPLRSFIFQKRYSEFAALHATLTDLVGEKPPEPLPGKSWFRSTVASAELTEVRRIGLEAYLRAIAESPDRRWRDTSAWRTFMNLPSTASSGGGRSTNSSSAVAGAVSDRLPAIGMPGANEAAAADPGTWLDLHKEMKKALHDARLQLARRDAADSGSNGMITGSTTAAVEAGAAAKRELVKAGSLLTALSAGLKSLQDAKRLGDGELRRRRDLLAAARVEREGLETLSTRLARTDSGSTSSSNNNNNNNNHRHGPVATGEHASLFGGTAVASGSSSGSRGGRGRVLGAPLPETDRTRDQDNAGVVQVQRQMMAEQDQEVAALAKIVRRQREMGLAIKQEVDLQAPMLQQMNDDVDRVHGKMKVAKERVKRLG